MALANNVPVFLSPDSGYTPEQCNSINILVRTARRSFESKARQIQEDKPVVEKLITRRYGRVLEPKDYLYGKNFSLQFILNPFGFELDGRYALFETKHTIKSIQMQGANSSITVGMTITSLGHLYVGYLNNNQIVYFVCDTDDWPSDHGIPTQFSVYMNGLIA
jgi:hypothetical protein